MSSTIVETIGTAKRNVTIIGTVPLTDQACWSQLQDALFKRLDSTEVRCQIIAESDTQLFQHSLRTDTPYAKGLTRRITFTQLKFRKEMLTKEIAKSEKRSKQASFVTSTLPISAYVVVVDDEIYWLPVAAYFESAKLFQSVGMGDPLYPMISEYVASLTDKERDGRYSSAPGKELLELFDQNHIPRGIYPRDCFYNTDHYQFVVWDFVFSRQGEILIHKRSENAKDNQGMWDKSVGGHIDFQMERNSYQGAARELIEELFTVEKDQQTGHEFSLLGADISKMFFLGEWRPGTCGPDYLNHLSVLEEGTSVGEEPWFYYQLPGGSLEHNTPRILPGGGERKLRVLADVFVFIANTVMTPDFVAGGKALENSSFRFVEPSRLKSWAEQGTDDYGQEFKVTPDLQFILSGRYRDIIDEISQLIQYSGIRKY